MNFTNRLSLVRCVIPAGQQLATIYELNGNTSSYVDTGGGQEPCRIYMPVGWDTANIEFLTSPDGVVFQSEKIDGTAIAITVESGINTPLPPIYTYGIRYFKVKSSAIQSADRIIYILLRPI